MRRQYTSAALCLLLAPAASGQSFVMYQMTGYNESDRGRGLDGAEVGDRISVFITAEHDGFSYAGGKIEYLSTGVAPNDVTLWEDNVGTHWWKQEMGRYELLRTVVSDAPPDAVDPFNRDVVVLTDGTITDEDDDFIDLVSIPGPLGGLVGAFPMLSGQFIFGIQYRYMGGLDLWDAGHNGRARLWRGPDDINGIEVLAFSGDTLVVSPAPGVIVVLAIGGVFGSRRRR